MKIGINCWAWGSHFSNEEYLALIGRAKSLGAELVEICIEDDREIDTQAIGKALRDEGLGCSIVGVFGPHLDVSSEDAGIRGGAVDFAEHCIGLSARLGTDVFTGAVAGVGGKEVLSDAGRRTRLDHAAEGLRRIGDLGSAAACASGSRS